MRFITIAATVAAVTVVATASPTTTAPSTIDVLNYALTLEHLEAAFYNIAFTKFSTADFTAAGVDSTVLDRLEHIREHENVHVSTLTSVIESLNGNPVPPCTYDFPLNNVTQFLAIAQALENTGVSAYTGAIAGLQGDYLTAAATIATVEARHASYLNELWDQLGFPYAFDTPLSPPQVVTIATSFIKECPYKIPITPNTHLTATIPASGSKKVTTTFVGKGSNSTENTFCQFLYGERIAVSPRAQCRLPDDAIGYVYVFVTADKSPVNKPNSTILAGPTLLFNGTHIH
ncbi:hypothetical protein BGZ99_003905 [Dissophora globulifera]|uniref:Uncharacterized protein n=1 Tax=Dissophora globulifera TaxID=979702 RepID=A0A9P6UVR9_9FUNG|nr:hypothetical protein BGZ99_003905 [Dissophora globulifera]